MNGTPAHDHTCPLPDGRLLGWAEYGARGGSPVFYFHGLPSSRLEAAVTEPHAGQLGLRIIAVDRPGFGLSTFQPGRRMTDWPGDIAALADALGLSRFAVMGTSGGGPYTLACAAKLADRVTRASVLCGLGQVAGPPTGSGFRGFSRFALGAARRAPSLLPMLCVPVSWGLHTWVVDAYLKRFAHRQGALDRTTLLDPAVRGSLVAAFKESARAGHRGPCWDLRLASAPWGFDPATIRIPVTLFHGEEDAVVPAGMTRSLAAAIPGVQARFFPGEGHYALPVRHAREALEFLL